MLTLIGLIIAVYAIVRLCQIPFEHAAYEQRWLGMSFSWRSLVVCTFSILGLLMLVLFTYALLRITWSFPTEFPTQAAISERK